MEWSIQQIIKEWDVIKEVPLSLIIIIIVLVILFYWSSKGIIARKNDLIKDLRLKLSLSADVIKKGSESAEAGTLKERALILSLEILSFAAEIDRGDLPQPEDHASLIKYVKGIRSVYIRKFGAKVIAVHNELANAGLIDKEKELDIIRKPPPNIHGIKVVGERIGALALQLEIVPN